MRKELAIKDCMLYPNAKLSDLKRNRHYKNVTQFFEIPYNSSNTASVISDYKLILRPIESLTEEEMFEIDDLDGDGKNPLDVKVRDQEYIEVDLTNVAISDYLRSINIDIDGFIASGKAVAE